MKTSVQERRSSQGYILPLSLAVGLTVTLVALTMIARVRTNKVAARSQVSSAGSLAAAEAGMDRTIARLNQTQFSHLLALDYDSLDPNTPWLNPDNFPACFANQAAFEAEFLSGDVGGSSQTFNVISYDYDPTVGAQSGLLTVEGQSGLSRTRVQQRVPIAFRPGTFPGLLGTYDVSIGGNDVEGVEGNVVCTNLEQCPVSCTGDNNTATELNLLAAINGNENTTMIGGSIFLGNVNLPPVLTFPGVITGNGNGAYTIPAITTGPTTLPRSTDNPNPVDNVYHYQVPSIDLGGNSSQQLIIDIKAGESVYLYLQGDLTLSGNATIVTRVVDALDMPILDASGQPIDVPPAAVRIYGNDDALPDNMTNQTIMLNGNTCLSAFVYAPNALMGVNGGGSCSPNIDGAVWVKRWDGSNGNGVEISVPDGIAAALGNSTANFANNTQAPEDWSRQGVN